MAEIPAPRREPMPEDVNLVGSSRLAWPTMSPANLAQTLSSHRALFVLGLMIVFVVQLPAFTYFFYNDDYVPFAEIVDNGIPRYISNLILVQDITPNWRVVPGLFYLAGYETFGMQALPYHVVSMACHLATCAMLYHITRRTTGLAWAGFLSAVMFGVNPTHVFTVPQVTSMNNVQGAFFGVATLAALIEACFDRERRWPFYCAAIVLFVLAIASNESTAMLFPVYGLAILSFWNVPPVAAGRERLLSNIPFRDRCRAWRGNIVSTRTMNSFVRPFARASLLSLPFATIGVTALASFWACRCNEASSSFFGWGNARYLWQIYIGRIAWPIGALEAPNRVSEPHQIAAIAVVVLIVFVAVWGPPLARIGGAFLIFATIPYIAVWALTAQRYTYQATAGFALLVPAVLAVVWDLAGPRGRRALAIAGVPVIALVVGWYSWQTHVQSRPFADKTEQWHRLVDDVGTAFPSVPPDSRVVVIGGDLTDVIYQFHVMPSIAHVTWNSNVRMYSVPPDSPGAAEALEHQDTWFVAVYQGRRLVPVGRAAAAAEAHR